MQILFILLLVALLASICGFKKYVWFISIGYGAAIAALGLAIIIIFHRELTLGSLLQALLLILYGCRLGGYLAYRELKSASYVKNMKTEIKSGDDMSFVAKAAIWISAAILYLCETSPLIFRLQNHKGTDIFSIIGMLIMILGLSLETLADLQKNKAKKKNPHRFVDTGLFRLVRCPNYLGEMTFWTGCFISGIHLYHGAFQWVMVLIGYLGIIYVMFGGARRLEIRQDKNYGEDPEYQAYKKSTPIMIPFIPLYSVKKHKWLVA